MESPPAKLVKRPGATYARAAKRRQSSSTAVSSQRQLASSDSDSTLTPPGSPPSSDNEEEDLIVTRKPSKARSTASGVGRRKEADVVGKGKAVDWDAVPDGSSSRPANGKTTGRVLATAAKRKLSSVQVGEPESASGVEKPSTRRKMVSSPASEVPAARRTSSVRASEVSRSAPAANGRSTRATSSRTGTQHTDSPAGQDPVVVSAAAAASRDVPARHTTPSHAPLKQPAMSAAPRQPPTTAPSQSSTSRTTSNSVPSAPLASATPALQPSVALTKPSDLPSTSARPNAQAGPSSPSKSAPSTPKRSRASTPKALTPSQVRHERIGTPTRPARDLSSLFASHGQVLTTGSSPELGSPKKIKKLAPNSGDSDVDEDDGPATVLVNLPRTGGGGMVSRMLKRSNTAPDGALGRAGSTSADAQQAAPIGSPLRNRLSTDASGSSYFALSQSASLFIPPSPVRNGSATGGPPSTSGSAPPSPGPVVAPVRPPLGQRRTYGGGTRSMLASMEGIGGEGGVVEDRGESYAVLSKRWGIEDEGTDSQDMADLPTITELRARGENQRFLDDLGYIVDGLQAESVEVKRPSAVDLVRRLVNLDFRRSVKTLDEGENLYTVLREAGAGDGDMVLDAALAVFLTILSQDDRALDPIIRRKGNDCFTVVGKMMRSREDGFSLVRSVAKGKTVRSKDRAAVNLLTELARIRGLASEGQDNTQISLRGMASSFLESVVSATVSRVDRYAVLESAGVSARIAASLELEVDGLPARVRGYAKGLPLLPEEDGPDLDHIASCLTVLENLVVRFPQAQGTVERDHPNLPSLLGTLLVASLALSGSDDDNESISLSLIGLNTLATALRVLVNVTNTSPFWCEGLLGCAELTTALLRIICDSELPSPAGYSPRDLSTAALRSSPHNPSVVPSSSPLPGVGDSSNAMAGGGETAVDAAAAAEAVKVDALCLALGLLNNLVEGVSSAKDTIRQTELSSSCSGSRACVLKCRCSDRRSGLLVLVNFYAKQSAGMSTESSYLTGYSILLLSHLLDSSPVNASIILDALPSPRSSTNPTPAASSTLTSSLTATRQSKLLRMAAELKDFADVHQRFHDKLTTLAAASARSKTDLDDAERGEEDGRAGGGLEVLPTVVPSVEEGVGAVQRTIGVLEGLAAEEGVGAGLEGEGV